jgi:hypothetical protein
MFGYNMRCRQQMITGPSVEESLTLDVSILDLAPIQAEN